MDNYRHTFHFNPNDFDSHGDQRAYGSFNKGQTFDTSLPIIATFESGKWVWDYYLANAYRAKSYRQNIVERLGDIFGVYDAEIIEETGPHKCVNKHCINKTYPLNVFCDDCRAKIGW